MTNMGVRPQSGLRLLPGHSRAKPSPAKTLNGRASPPTRRRRSRPGKQLQRLDPRRDPTGRSHPRPPPRSRPRRSRGAHPTQTPASLSSRRRPGSAAGYATATDSCSQHTPGESQGQPRTTPSSQLISQNGLPIRVSHNEPLSRESDPPGRAGRSFMPGQRPLLYRPRLTRCAARIPSPASRRRCLRNLAGGPRLPNEVIS